MTAVQSVLAAIRDFSNADFSHYTETLKTAFSEVDPLFVRPKYADFFWHCSTTVPGWLPHIVLASPRRRAMGLWSC